MHHPNEHLMPIICCKLGLPPTYNKLSIVETQVKDSHILFFVLDIKTNTLHYVEVPYTQGKYIREDQK